MKILLLLMTFQVFANETPCLKRIAVNQRTQQFFVAFPFPKIITTEKDTNIEISCQLYEKVKVGDYLETDQIKDFNFNLDDGIPHGVLRKHLFKVLGK